MIQIINRFNRLMSVREMHYQRKIVLNFVGYTVELSVVLNSTFGKSLTHE